MAGAGFGVPNDSGGWAFKVDPDGNMFIGDESTDVVQITGSVHHLGIETQAPSSQALASADSTTITSIGSNIMFLDASSITGVSMGGGMYVHTLNIPNGSSSGQKLTLIVESNFGSSNNVIVSLAGNINGAQDPMVPNTKTSVSLVYYSTASISAWYQV